MKNGDFRTLTNMECVCMPAEVTCFKEISTAWTNIQQILYYLQVLERTMYSNIGLRFGLGGKGGGQEVQHLVLKS